MSMVIGTNISSLTAQRHLETSRADLNQSMERLSSGSRINSAMDDAAGLSISDRMDSQVNGLSQAVRNTNDAISLGQTAEGALSETTAILQRMRDLSVQSGNATNTAADRTAMQSEVTNLQSELTRISTASTFNNKALLDGSFTSGAFQIGHKASDTVSLSISAMGAADLNKVESISAIASVTAVAATSVLTFDTTAVAGNNTSVTVGNATLAYDFLSGDFATAGSETTTETATAFAAAWNASTNTNVAGFTAAASTNTVTFTQDTASTGALTSTVTNSAVTGTDIATTMAAGPKGLAAVSVTAATATLTIVGDPAATTDSNTVTIGGSTFSYAADSADLTGDKVTYAASFKVAFNAEAARDAELAAFTATVSGAVVTFTRKTAAHADGNFENGGAISISVAETGPMDSIAVAAITGIAAVTAVKATATQTFTAAATANETLTTKVGDGTFNYNFGTTAMTSVAATASAFATAWNASTDTEVAKFDASANSSGVITYTQAAAATNTNIKNEVTAVLSGSTIRDGDKLSLTAGSATFEHTFTTNDLTVTQNAAQYVAAYNASTDADVSKFTASNDAGTIKLTEDVATTGNVAKGQTFTQTNAAASNGAIATAANAVTGVALVTVSSIDNGNNEATGSIAAGTAGKAGVTGVTGVTGSSVNTLDISTTSGATAAITSLDLAIAEVGAERAKLGAFQNRLEHTVSNLSSMIENTSAARSRIQDADFAVESANLAKNQVMQQAGTAMLAQANASSQGVLSLLK